MLAEQQRTFLDATRPTTGHAPSCATIGGGRLDAAHSYGAGCATPVINT